MSGKLLPCPFCGSVKQTVLGPTCQRHDEYDPNTRAFPIIRCGGCFTDVPGTDWDNSGQTAIANWNRRAALSTLPIPGSTPEWWQDEAAAEREFTEYFVRNYPGPDTVIFDPKWHAPKLFRAAKLALLATNVQTFSPIAGEGKVKALVKAAKGDEPNRSGLRLPVRAGGNGYGGRGVTTTALNALADLIGHAKFVEANFGISYAHLTEAEDAFNAACKISSPGKDGGQEVEVVAWLHPTANWSHVDYDRVRMHCGNDGPLPVPLYAAPSPQSTVDAVQAVANFLKERDESVLPDEVDDAEREASARCILRVVAKSPSGDRAASEGNFARGDRVTKTKGSSWTGRVVGFYSTELTPIGYAVESETERGSVQIYPESALAEAKGSGQ